MTRTHRGRVTLRRRTAAAMVTALAATTVGVRAAGAQCRVLPGSEGEIGTWIAAGAVPLPLVRPPRALADQTSAAAAMLAATTAHPRVGSSLRPGVPWRAVAGTSTRVDLEEPPRARGPRAMLAGATLVVARDARVHLFLGSDDALAYVLDGVLTTLRTDVRGAREDDDHVELPLRAGRHELMFLVVVNGGTVRLAVRITDGNFQPSPDVRVVLDGVDPSACARLATASIDWSEQRNVVTAGTHVRVRASFPAGTAVRADETRRTLSLAGAGLPAGMSATIAVDGSAAVAGVVEATLPAVETATVRVEITSGAGVLPAVRAVGIRVPAAVRDVLLRSQRLLEPLSEASPPAWLPRGSLTSMRYVAERLAALVSAGDDDIEHWNTEARQLRSLLDAVEAQRDPYRGRTGTLRRAYRSDIDGTLQGYSIYVPPSYRGDHAFPLVEALHGMGGTSHRMLPVLFGLYDEHESRTHADRHLPPLPDTRAILVAPYGFGDTGYRALGEVDVLAVLDEVRAAYRIDPNRTYMTGLSMGGIGAAWVALRNPSEFAATAPLCGYHSYFVRSDTRGVRRPWETFLMETRSNAVWAENGSHLPMYIVHGTLDRPTDNSRVLVDRYTQLGFRIESEWPELGHNVWSTTYANGRIVPYFLRFRRDPAPRHVHFRTATLRARRSFWVDIDGLARHDAWGDVVADANGTTLRIRTTDVSAMTLSPPASLAPANAQTWAIDIDGQTLASPVGQPIYLSRVGGTWRIGSRTLAPLAGPIRDVVDRPIAVVYGTHDATETALNLRVARTWARGRSAIRVEVPIVRDDDVTAEFARTHSLIVVGTPRSNAYLQRVQSRLPIRIDGDTIVAGSQRIHGAEIGTTFVVPHPDSRDRELVVVTAPTALGVWRSRFLPDLVPDFVVYDAAMAPARGRILLGARATVRAAGFFAPDGTVPAVIADPVTTTAPTTAGSPAASPNDDDDAD